MSKKRVRNTRKVDSVKTKTLSSESGDYIVLNGDRLALVHHPTDFSVIQSSPALLGIASPTGGAFTPLTLNMVRAHTSDSQARDTFMDRVRSRAVAHHIYRIEGTNEELIMDDRIFLILRYEDPIALEEVIRSYKLIAEGRLGNAYVLRVTEATGKNPLKTANEIAEREEVASCTPQLLVPMQLHQADLAATHRLFRRQWYLASELMTSPDIHPMAGIRASEAWQITKGSPDVVIAVLDDGFDLEHPAFLNKRIHPAQRDFGVTPVDDDPRAEGGDYHGTCVASIATGSLADSGMVGVAPDCTLLPVRLGFGPMAPQVDLLAVFRYVSQFADVVNCSFGLPPSEVDRLHPEFRNGMTELTRFGGRRGKGLVIVFSAGNDDAPTFLRSGQNRNGVRYVVGLPNAPRTEPIRPGKNVFSGHPMTRGVIVVGAISSLKRKAGYSCWGPHITVVAPSNNMHYIMEFVPRGVEDVIRDRFVANYRGRGQIAAVNRPGRGLSHEPLPDDVATPDFAENFYTEKFGGTSGAAPIVSGVAALMLSVNPNLTAEQVRQILIATADRELDTTLDLPDDPNLQGFDGAFINGHSIFFGAGKVDAFRAVERARALLI